MKLNKITKKNTDGRVILSAEIQSENFPGIKSVFFSYPEKYQEYIPVNADPFFPAMLIPAMLMKEELEIIPPLSSKLYDNQSVIQDIFTVWFPEKFTRVKVLVNEIAKEPHIKPSRNAVFFSLGVDSMYSMLKYLPENNPPKGKDMNSLIYMKGLELPLSIYSKGQGSKVIERIKQLAEHYNLELIAGETNLRDVFPINWEDHYFGPGLAATALSLSNGFKNIFIPSSYSYANIFPVPSSPLIDSYWSNEKTNIIHDGAEKDRAEKIAGTIINDPFALNNLRVCVDNEGGDYNCGRCWKCIRTMTTLEILDQLKSSASFPDELPENYNLKLKTYIYDSMLYSIENLKLARKYNKRKIEKTIEREIRLGRFDQLREGKSILFLSVEFVKYLYIKISRRIRMIHY